jgi:hypothetical protein
MIGARASPGCELCKRERNMDLKTTDILPTETLAHIQSAGCKAQKKKNKAGERARVRRLSMRRCLTSGWAPVKPQFSPTRAPSSTLHRPSVLPSPWMQPSGMRSCTWFRIVSGEWSPACVAIPRRGYWRVRVVPGGETRGVCGFQPSRSWEWFVGIDLGVFPRVSVG